MFGGMQLEIDPHFDGRCRWVPIADMIGPFPDGHEPHDTFVRTFTKSGFPTGLAIAESSPNASPDELENAGQLTFTRFHPDGVQMTFNAWRRGVAENTRELARAFGSGTKMGRSLKGQARDFEECGKFGEVSTCTGCGTEEANLVTICNVKVCQYCSWVRSAGTRAAALEKILEDLMKRRTVHTHGDGQRERYKLRVVTLTKRWDPEDAQSYHPDSMREHLADLVRVKNAVWRNVLSRDAWGTKLREAGLHWEIEEPFGGGIHMHCLYWGLFVDVAAVRMEIALELGVNDEGKANGNVDVEDPETYELDRLKKRKEKRKPTPKEIVTRAVKEAVKYAVKGSSPKRSIGKFAQEEVSARLDPALAALFLASFMHQKLRGGHGSLKSIKKRGIELEPTTCARECRGCGKADLARFAVAGPVSWLLGKEPVVIERRFVHRSMIRPVDLRGVVKLPVPKDRVRSKERNEQLARYVGALEPAKDRSDGPPRDFTSTKPPPDDCPF